MPALILAALLLAGCAHPALLCREVTIMPRGEAALYCAPTVKHPLPPVAPTRRPDVQT